MICHWQLLRKAIFFEDSTIKASMSVHWVHWLAQTHIKWPSGCTVSSSCVLILCANTEKLLSEWVWWTLDRKLWLVLGTSTHVVSLFTQRHPQAPQGTTGLCTFFIIWSNSEKSADRFGFSAEWSQKPQDNGRIPQARPTCAESSNI